MILGRNLILTLGDESQGLAASKSCNLSVDTDFIEVCSPVDGSWRDFLPTVKSWSASVDTLVASLSDHKKLLQKQNNNEKLVCCFFDQNLQEFYKGYVYIKGLQIKGTIGSLATMGVTLQPTGKLTWAEETVVDMSRSGIVVENRVISNNGSISAIVGRNLVLNEIVMSAYTRISLPTGAVLVKGDATTVAGYITDLETDRFRMATYVANFTGEYKDCRMQPGTVTVVASSLNTNELRYLSKF